MKPLEKDIQKAIRRKAEEYGVVVRKFASPNQRGVPDLLMLGPSGRCAFVEVKRPGGKVSALQRKEIDLYVWMGHKAIVADSVIEALPAIYYCAGISTISD